MNASNHEQIGSRTYFPKKKVSGDEHASQQQQFGDKLGVSAEERQLLCNFRSVHIPARIRRAFS
jgi:hypothetical protein